MTLICWGRCLFLFICILCWFGCPFLNVLGLNQLPVKLGRLRTWIAISGRFYLLQGLLLLWLSLISFELLSLIAFSRAHEGLWRILALGKFLVSSLFVAMNVDINAFLLLRIQRRSWRGRTRKPCTWSSRLGLIIAQESTGSTCILAMRKWSVQIELSVRVWLILWLMNRI